MPRSRCFLHYGRLREVPAIQRLEQTFGFGAMEYLYGVFEFMLCYGSRRTDAYGAFSTDLIPQMCQCYRWRRKRFIHWLSVACEVGLISAKYMAEGGIWCKWFSQLNPGKHWIDLDSALPTARPPVNLNTGLPRLSAQERKCYLFVRAAQRQKYRCYASIYKICRHVSLKYEEAEAAMQSLVRRGYLRQGVTKKRGIPWWSVVKENER